MMVVENMLAPGIVNVGPRSFMYVKCWLAILACEGMTIKSVVDSSVLLLNRPPPPSTSPMARLNLIAVDAVAPIKTWA